MRKLFCLPLLLLLVAYTHVSAQTQPEKTYYVVIGVFGKIDNAVRYTNLANQRGFNAQYAIHSKRNLNYVYLFSTTDKRKAYAFTIKMRAETQYKDAWVFEGKLGEGQSVSGGQEDKPGDKPGVDEKPVVEVKPVVDKPIEDKPVEDKPVTEVDSVATDSIQKPVVEKPEVKPVVKKPSGKPFFFKLENKENGNPVQGEIHIQESTNATRYQAFKANEIVYLEAPKNARGNYVIVTQAAGFQPSSLILSYSDPSPEKGAEGEAVVPIELGRAKRGDYIDFTNVRFFRNSSILEPVSQNELDGLVDLMKEMPGYKIRIHGHCNGTNDREGSLLGTSTNYFALEASKNKVGRHSAKVLTADRAATVKAYLVSQGIDESRIDVKGDGGKIPIYPSGGTLGQYNERVEIEITKR